MSVAIETNATVAVIVELFGNAQLIAGQRLVPIEVPPDCTSGEIAKVLAQQHPRLIGKVIRSDISGFLSSYSANLNGIQFVRDDRIKLKNGDSLLLFSSQAGG
jgi:molybdopterin converting factor small subunit